MHLFRLAIVLFIVVLFLPSSAEEKQRVHQSVSDAVQQVAGFCERNATLCDNVGSFAGAVADRAYYGAEMVYEAAIGPPRQGQGAQRPARPYPSQFDTQPSRNNGRARTQPARSSDTLRREDRAPAWRGPGDS
jgi:hypothetical protein